MVLSDEEMTTKMPRNGKRNMYLLQSDTKTHLIALIFDTKLDPARRVSRRISVDEEWGEEDSQISQACINKSRQIPRKDMFSIASVVK